MQEEKITKLVTEYKKQQEDKLRQWCIDNPGKVMNNYSTRINVCTNILNGEFTIEEMKLISSACVLLHRASKSMNGWYVSHRTYEEIIELCNV